MVSSLTQVSETPCLLPPTTVPTHSPLPHPHPPLTPPQIMLDPTLRTIAGLEALIQKEWVAMGHPFAFRHKMVSSSDGKDESEGFVSGAFVVDRALYACAYVCVNACVCACVCMYTSTCV